MTKVKDVMTKGVFSVQKDFLIREIAEVMIENSISGVAVLGSDNSIEGVISDTDILSAIISHKELSTVKAEEIMFPLAITAEPEMELKEVAEIMDKERIHRLFVTTTERVTPSTLSKSYRQRPIGIISSSDIMKNLKEG